MAILGENERFRPAGYALPKPWVPFGLAAALWTLIFALGTQGVQVLHALRF